MYAYRFLNLLNSFVLLHKLGALNLHISKVIYMCTQCVCLILNELNNLAYELCFSSVSTRRGKMLKPESLTHSVEADYFENSRYSSWLMKDEQITQL
jgi:hypothetical protein